MLIPFEDGLQVRVQEEEHPEELRADSYRVAERVAGDSSSLAPAQEYPRSFR